MSGSPKLFYATIIIAVLVCIIVYSKGVKIEGVGLASGLPYVRVRFEAHFSYNLTLEQNEIVRSVLWTKDGQPGIYEWTERGINKSGVFENASAVANKSGEFEFEAAEYLAGNYTLKITTNMGSDSQDFNFIVFAYSQSSLTFSTNIYPRCIWDPAVFYNDITPYPNITCVFKGGIFGDSYEIPVKQIGTINEKIEESTHGYFEYYMYSKIPIEKVPLESSFVCRNNIKSSEFNVKEVKVSSVSGQPCYEPLNITIYTLKKIRGEHSCHGGYVPLTEFNYTCPNIHNSPNKTIKCGIGGQWLEKDDKPWPNCNSRGTNSKITLPVLLSFVMILVRCNSQVSSEI